MFSINTVTELGTGVDHLVSSAELDRVQQRQPGTYLALCGALIDPAPLVQPPSGRCGVCIRRAEQTKVPRPSPWWVWLIGRQVQRADHGVQHRGTGP